MPTGSDTQIRVELTLLTGGQAIKLRADQYLQSLEVEEIGVGSWTGSVVLFDAQGDFLENLVIAAGAQRQIIVTFGRGDQEPSENATFTGAITEYTPQFEPHGVTFTASLVSGLLTEALLDRRIRTFEAGLTISEIVQRIATDRGWEVLIEPTADVMSEPFSSRGESDFKFINEQLRPQAVSVDGEGGYLCYLDKSNRFHFHTPDFDQPQTFRFVYARSQQGEVIEFTPSDASFFGKLMGGGNSLFEGLSSLDGTSTNVSSTTVGGVDGSGYPIQSDSNAKLDYGDGVHAYVDLVSRDPDELRRLARVRFDEFRRIEYPATLRVIGTHRVRIGDYADVDYVKLDGARHYLSGRFQVHRVKHTVDTSAWLTEFTAIRSGIPNLEGTVPVNGTQTNTPPDGSSGGGFDVEGETI